MKKISIVLSVVLALGLCLAGCGTAKEAETTAEEAEEVVEEAGAIAGGWTISEELTNASVPSDVAELLEKGLEGYAGMGLEPVALLGTQVVAGVNYAILCKGTTVTATPVTKLVVAILYADLEGNAEIRNVADFNLSDYANTDVAVEAEQLAGGWSVYEEVPNIVLSERAQNAFDSATEELLGVGYSQIAVLGTQVVAGTNYAILALKTTVTAEPVSQMCVVTIYAGVDGSNELLTIADINIADFNK